MSHHVGVRIVHDNGVKLALLNRLHDGIRDSLRRHFRLQIVRRDLRRRHQNPLFAFERLLDSTIEKVRHVRVLLRLRRPQILVIQPRKHLR